jgi:hypothetical protein
MRKRIIVPCTVFPLLSATCIFLLPGMGMYIIMYIMLIFLYRYFKIIHHLQLRRCFYSCTGAANQYRVDRYYPTRLFHIIPLELVHGNPAVLRQCVKTDRLWLYPGAVRIDFPLRLPIHRRCIFINPISVRMIAGYYIFSSIRFHYLTPGNCML